MAKVVKVGKKFDVAHDVTGIAVVCRPPPKLNILFI